MSNMNLKNLTPHAINLVTPNGVVTVAPSGVVARCRAESTVVGEASGVPLTVTTYGEVEGLPEPKAGTLYVVSALVRLALPGRLDLASPGELLRDAAGAVVGARGLVVNGRPS